MTRVRFFALTTLLLASGPACEEAQRSSVQAKSLKPGPGIETSHPAGLDGTQQGQLGANPCQNRPNFTRCGDGGPTRCLSPTVMKVVDQCIDGRCVLGTVINTCTKCTETPGSVTCEG
jgi:hypothetical protein